MEPVLTYSRSPGQTGMDAIVAAFSERSVSIDPAEMDPLYEWVDVEALDTLVESTCGGARISTVIWGYQVTITPGTVEVYGPA